ncbi:hypothetical protein D3C83_183640 [compost metagenome]
MIDFAHREHEPICARRAIVVEILVLELDETGRRGRLERGTATSQEQGKGKK